MGFKELLKESLEEKQTFGIKPFKGQQVNKLKNDKMKVLTVLSVTGNQVTFSDGSKATLEDGMLPVGEYSLIIAATESKENLTEAKRGYFTLTVDVGNAAFEDVEYELSRIIKDVAKKIENGSTHGAAMDLNGNKVGKFMLDLSDDEMETETEIEEAKCGKKPCKCGSRKKAVDGECPECGAIMEAMGKIGGQSLFFDNDNDRKKAQRLESAYVKDNPEAPFREVKAFITYGVKQDKPYKQIIGDFKELWAKRVG